LSEAALAPAAPHRSLTWDELQALVLDSVASPHSKRAYAWALEDFAEWAKQAGQGTAFGKALFSAIAHSSRRKASRRPRSTSASPL
jgi:hypothetical protein